MTKKELLIEIRNIVSAVKERADNEPENTELYYDLQSAKKMQSKAEAIQESEVEDFYDQYGLDDYCANL